jgi:hypothetical protein
LKTQGISLEAGMHRWLLRDKPMFRFDQLIRRDMIVREVKQRYPQTIPLFEQFRFHSVCDDCDIGTIARKNGLNLPDVLDALNQAAFGSQAGMEEHGSNPIC